MGDYKCNICGWENRGKKIREWRDYFVCNYGGCVTAGYPVCLECFKQEGVVPRDARSFVEKHALGPSITKFYSDVCCPFCGSGILKLKPR